MKLFGGFSGQSPTPLARERVETKLALPSTRCEIRTLGATLIEDGSGMPSKPPMVARTLTPAEIAIPDGTQTVRSCLVLYVWVQI